MLDVQNTTKLACHKKVDLKKKAEVGLKHISVCWVVSCCLWILHRSKKELWHLSNKVFKVADITSLLPGFVKSPPFVLSADFVSCKCKTLLPFIF